ncbi:hypothetical protein EV672_102261 [Aquabacterium commune]|uniref:Uncharacterized protein n=1 Tax=Aquabacterium commune TaxID=70586 RepID=A0A4R6RHF7_9BURK|nr:hypothetical protein [Aquabacterium commune]TDP85911.1 hypothetical protein EV672_102261 [Aquabacterium commune]
MSLHAHLPEAAGVSAPEPRKLSRWSVVLALLAIVAVLDAATGYEVSVFLLYTIPVALSTHYLGVRAGVVVSTLATLAWAFADQWSGHTYSQDWILAINAFNRFCCFLLAVMAIRFIEERRAAVALRLRAFTGEVPHCTQCDKLCGEDGHWRTPEMYLSELGGADVLPKVCPDCARRVYARAAYRDTPDAIGAAPDGQDPQQARA